jgi:hypothetical protein
MEKEKENAEKSFKSGGIQEYKEVEGTVSEFTKETKGPIVGTNLKIMIGDFIESINNVGENNNSSSLVNKDND